MKTLIVLLLGCIISAAFFFIFLIKSSIVDRIIEEIHEKELHNSDIENNLKN